MKRLIQLVKNLIKWIINIPLRIRLKNIGTNSRVVYPYIIEGAKYISVGDNVRIYNNVYMQAIKKDVDPVIKIGSNIRMWYNTQLSAVREIVIEDGCTFAANCFISDTTHDYTDITTLAYFSKLKELNPVRIGAGTWVGRNVTIMGCKIGKHCVIGNSSFVTKDIPDYCVVVGNPAIIIKRYDMKTNQWLKTDKNGNFLYLLNSGGGVNPNYLLAFDNGLFAICNNYSINIIILFYLYSVKILSQLSGTDKNYLYVYEY